MLKRVLYVCCLDVLWGSMHPFTDAEKSLVAEIAPVKFTSDLSNWVASNKQELAVVTIRCLYALHALHSRNYLHGNVIGTSFKYEGENPLQILATNFMHSSYILKKDNLSAVNGEIASLLRIVSGCTNDSYPELALALIKLGTQAYTENLFWEIVDVVRRLLLPTGILDPIFVDRFNKRLTLDELLFRQAEPIQVADECLPAMLSTPSGRFIRTATKELNAGIYIGNYKSAKLSALRLFVSQDPFLAMREHAILAELAGMDGIPTGISLGTGISSLCAAHVSATVANILNKQGHKIGTVDKAEFIGAFMVRGLEILKSIHEKGFVHGSIRLESFLFVNGAVRLNPSKIQIIDFTFAGSWLQPVLENPPIAIEPLWLKSVFELDGAPPNRLDDVFRLCEAAFRLSGQPRFQPAWWDEPMDPITIRNIKLTDRLLEATGYPVPTPVTTMYLEILEMKANDEPKYDFWIESIKRGL